MGPHPRDFRPMQIDCDFPGGNIVVEGIDGDHAYLRQDLRDTEGNWFYWSFRVRDFVALAGRDLTFRFTGTKVLGTRGPCVSVDGGHSWDWLGPVDVEKNRFVYPAPPGITELRFAMNWPYLQADLDRFLEPYEFHPHFRREILCRDRSGRPVDKLVVGCIDRKPKYRVLLTARHHACESIPNFALEGILTRVLRGDLNGDLDDWCRNEVQFWIVPFMDADGVEAGDQGKNRRPYDHNRDYAANPSLYPTVRALREQVPAWLDGGPFLGLDLHCPGIRGDWHEHIYFVGSPNPRNWAEVQRYAGYLAQLNQSELPYDPARNLPFGQAWNTNNEPGKLTCARWMATLPGCQMATTLEIPYANVGAATVTPGEAHSFGLALLYAMKAVLADNPPPAV